MSSIPSLPRAEYRRLGTSGLRVSVPILGAMSYGDPKWTPFTVSEEKALPVLKAAWDCGINTIDTANIYSNGESERIIASFIKKYDIPREKLVIMTKCGGPVASNTSVAAFMVPGIYGERDYINQCGLSRNAIFNSLEASLNRLNTSYVDLLCIHRSDPNTPYEETMRALKDLVEMGKVRYIGASSMKTWEFAEMNSIAALNGWVQFTSMQPEYSLLARQEENEMIPYCKYHGIGLIPYSVLAVGALANPVGVRTTRSICVEGTSFERQYSDADKMIVNRVEEIATKLGWTMAQVALAWVNAKVTSPIIGCNTVERLHNSILIRKVLSDEEIAYLEEPYAGEHAFGIQGLNPARALRLDSLK